MKRIFTSIFVLFAFISNAQSEFVEHENGLIYTSTAMSRLSQIVDAENEEFRSCTLTKEFKSLPQSQAYVFEISAKHASSLKKDVWYNIGLEDFLEKYNKEVTKEVLALKTTYSNYEDQEMVEIELLPKNQSMRFSLDEWKLSYKGNWILEESTNGKSWSIIYLKTALWQKQIPHKYARMIQYSECMIDTTVTVHPKDAYNSYEAIELPIQERFLSYVDKSYGEEEPELDYSQELEEKEYEEYDRQLKIYQEKKREYIQNSLSKEKEFNELLRKAYNEALENKYSYPMFESYVETYLSTKMALALKRNRVVVGMCSQDSSPRYHAMNIAQLAAESYSWDVFLRAHLDIMNDRFQRVSDGSYALEARSTYVKELEELNIDVNDLILGISLRTSNPSKNHYYGSIWRLGRAMAESKNKDVFRNELILGIENENLDTYNRVLLFYLFYNLQYNDDKNCGVKFNKERVEEIKELLPEYLHSLKY